MRGAVEHVMVRTLGVCIEFFFPPAHTRRPRPIAGIGRHVDPRPPDPFIINRSGRTAIRNIPEELWALQDATQSSVTQARSVDLDLIDRRHCTCRACLPP